MNGSGFMILSLPRSGSTTLACMLNEHRDIRCLIEPFHPRRYDGEFYHTAVCHSPAAGLQAVWRRWNGFKHVWEADGWPFRLRPELNDELVDASVRKVILLVRRNQFRRIVSNLLSRRTGLWMGTRTQFLQRLEGLQLPPLNPARVREQLQIDQAALRDRCERLAERQVPVMTLHYEDLFREDADGSFRRRHINTILEFLEFTTITADVFGQSWQPHFDPAVHRWATADVYRRIPGIERVEQEIASDETGWLFR